MPMHGRLSLQPIGHSRPGHTYYRLSDDQQAKRDYPESCCIVKICKQVQPHTTAEVCDRGPNWLKLLLPNEMDEAKRASLVDRIESYLAHG